MTHLPQPIGNSALPVCYASKSTTSPRSVAAKIIFNNLAIRQGLALRAESTDTVPGSRINPNVATALKSIGLDATNEFPKQNRDVMLGNNPVVATMGRADDSNLCPANDLQAAQDWELPRSCEHARRGSRIRHPRNQIAVTPPPQHLSWLSSCNAARSLARYDPPDDVAGLHRAECAAVGRVPPIVSQNHILPLAELPIVATIILKLNHVAHLNTVNHQHAVDYLNAFPW